MAFFVSLALAAGDETSINPTTVCSYLFLPSFYLVYVLGETLAWFHSSYFPPPILQSKLKKRRPFSSSPFHFDLLYTLYVVVKEQFYTLLNSILLWYFNPSTILIPNLCQIGIFCGIDLGSHFESGGIKNG